MVNPTSVRRDSAECVRAGFKPLVVGSILSVLGDVVMRSIRRFDTFGRFKAVYRPAVVAVFGIINRNAVERDFVGQKTVQRGELVGFITQAKQYALIGIRCQV